VATHHFDDERPLVGLGRGGDRVNCLNRFIYLFYLTPNMENFIVL
jgi:hypothetical protein